MGLEAKTVAKEAEESSVQSSLLTRHSSSVLAYLVMCLSILARNILIYAELTEDALILPISLALWMVRMTMD